MYTGTQADRLVTTFKLRNFWLSLRQLDSRESGEYNQRMHPGRGFGIRNNPGGARSGKGLFPREGSGPERSLELVERSQTPRIILSAAQLDFPLRP